MDALLIVVVVIACASMFSGFVILKGVFRRREDPEIPVARDANPGLGSRAQAKANTFANAIGRAIGFVIGIGLIIWPWLLMFAFGNDTHESHSKGRVLRIKNRARLPQRSTGAGWDDDIALHVTLSANEARVLGELWLLTARMEHASIAAFSQLSLQLTALGAPARLLEWSHRAALEEIRHARRCFAIASAVTGERHRPGPIAELVQPSGPAIDLVRLAIGSLIDGCLAEGMAADVAARGATTAEEPTIRATLEMIAREEKGHAELAWSVLEWCLDEGGAAVHQAVSARVALLSRELVPRLPDIDGIADKTLARHGVVDQDALGELAIARLRGVQERAARMLAPAQLARAA